MKAPATDWIGGFRSFAEQRLAQAKEAEKRQSAARNADSKPSLPLAKYAGRYNDAWHGEVTIALVQSPLGAQASMPAGFRQ
jgi:hypothetical protein